MYPAIIAALKILPLPFKNRASKIAKPPHIPAQWPTELSAATLKIETNSAPLIKFDRQISFANFSRAGVKFGSQI
ncbi:hypothetical protein CSUNSWCD_92 [Campylobacter showae CSUNSWCD]|uniref:Uncharacterized protein n=1 Tax=Campylobacter showae CSUNSWCD TaxID=1244083 RepID=M5IHY7_9BACT|nr:hypothetical protein CSUNSWCD_92 [Campylobacter showae CSUNSWCD]